MAVPRLGRVQLRIMQVLWKLDRATARQITDELNRESPIAHSTVQTLLRKIEAKGAVTYEKQGRQFIFRPLIRPEQVTRTATRDLINRVFDGSPAGLIAYLLENEKLSKKDLAELRRRITGAGHE